VLPPESIDTGSILSRTAAFIVGLRWESLPEAVRTRLPTLVLDALGCACAGRRLGVHGRFVDLIAAQGGLPESALWLDGRRLPAPHAALVNGAVAHHVEMDDGHPAASLHGGVTIIPAAVALAEAHGATGPELLTAVAAGYSAAVACGRPLLPGLSLHRLHPPSYSGTFGAAAASAHLLGLDAERTAHALALAALSLPFGPFEPFTRGAAVKDLYGGWPSLVGVTAALLAADGLEGPFDLFEAPADGLGSFLLHQPVGETEPPDERVPLGVQFKPFATCRSVQPALTALEALLPIDPRQVSRVVVETYPFAVGLSQDSDERSAIGAKTSIPYGVASCLMDGAVMPEAFLPDALQQPARRSLLARVEVRIAKDMVEPLVRGARVTVVMADGASRTSEVSGTRWGAGRPASEADLREKFRRFAGRNASVLEQAIDRLPAATDLRELMDALGRGLLP
jgi:2-methylcitrate dehydratase PrpD